MSPTESRTEIPPPDVWQGSLPLLVTLHGVNTDGAWQELVRPVFVPHTRYEPIKYPHYRGPIGIVFVVVELLVLVPGLVAIVALNRVQSITNSAAVLLAAGCVVLSMLLSRVRRRGAFKHVLDELHHKTKGVERPDMIAHSFGTYLTGKLMQRPDTRFRSAVLTGTVLARDFFARWLPTQADPAMPFMAIRNEVGRKDSVAAMAVLAANLVGGLGNAGFAGFKPFRDLVHDVVETDTCSLCSQVRRPAAGLIHNVRISEYAHNDQFITHQHALRFWLPFLWAIEPAEFTVWLENCRCASEMGNPIRKDDALLAEKLLSRRRWGWAGRRTIHRYIEIEYPTAARMLKDQLRCTKFYQVLWQYVALALDNATTHDEDPEKMTRARALEPRTAIRAAVASPHWL